MKSGVSADKFVCRSEKAGGLALVKILIMETENTAQNMNLQSTARKGMLEVGNPARRQAELMRLRKDWRRNGRGVVRLQLIKVLSTSGGVEKLPCHRKAADWWLLLCSNVG
jgi:hypothetical protein